MANELRARLLSAAAVGDRAVDPDACADLLPEGYRVLTAVELGIAPLTTLAEPFSAIPVLPAQARYPGEPLALLVGPDWATLDRLSREILMPAGDPPTAEAKTVLEDSISGSATAPELPPDDAAPGAANAAATAAPDGSVDGAPSTAESGSFSQIAEGTYTTRLQLHMADEALWAAASTSAGGTAGRGTTVRVPTQWPALVRASVAAGLGTQVRTVDVESEPTAGSRDAALWMSAYLAVVAAAASRTLRAPVVVALRADQRHLTGGRAPATVTWTSRIDEEGMLQTNTVAARLDLGAYPTLVDETQRRARLAVESLYRAPGLEYTAEFLSTPAVPMGAFEGVSTAPLAFAREVHFNRLAELAREDPIVWRQRHVRDDWPVLRELLGSLAEESDFHRRYGANELVRKRRLQLPRNTSALRGIGCAMAEQASGLTGERETGAITVRLEQGGTARLFCSLPTPTPRLTLAWRQLVAQELGLELDAVALDASYDSEQQDSGPRLFSRGASVIPRTIQSVCQAIQRQRFREPLPIQIRRSIRTSRAARTPANALRSAGAAAVEVVLLPASMEIDVKSVTMAVYAGRILDRGMAEAELRRGIYQALNWSLHEAVTDPTRLPPVLGGQDADQRYPTVFRGRPPRIRIVFGTSVKRDGPTGIGELPFSTVPAALTSALSQASGLYLDTLPTRPAALLRMLQEE